MHYDKVFKSMGLSSSLFRPCTCSDLYAKVSHAASPTVTESTAGVKQGLVKNGKSGLSFTANDGVLVPVTVFDVPIEEGEENTYSVITPGDGTFTLFNEKSGSAIARVVDKQERAKLKASHSHQPLQLAKTVSNGTVGSNDQDDEAEENPYALVTATSSVSLCGGDQDWQGESRFAKVISVPGSKTAFAKMIDDDYELLPSGVLLKVTPSLAGLHSVKSVAESLGRKEVV